MPAIASTMTEVAVDTDLAPLAARKSLRAKAFVATVALVAYVLVSAVYIAFERASIHASIESMNALSRHEKTLALTAAAVDGALAALVHLHAGPSTRGSRWCRTAGWRLLTSRVVLQARPHGPRHPHRCACAA